MKKKSIIAILVGTVVILTGAVQASGSVTFEVPAGCLGLWKFDACSGNVFFDTSGNGYHGQIDTSFGAFADGKDGLGLKDTGGWCNGDISGRVYNFPDLGTTSFTLEGWVDATTLSWYQYQPIMTKMYPPGGYDGPYILFGFDVDKKPSFHICDSVRYNSVTSLTSLMPGVWTHLVAVRDTLAKELRIYINGEKVASAPDTVTGSIDRTNVLAFFGIDTGCGWVTTYGSRLDDAAVYNRALTDAEIMQRYTGVLPVREITIDVKPGSFPNSINPADKGVIPVAILSTQVAKGELLDFDATTVDPLSVEFGKGKAKETHGKGHIEDVDGDGDNDLVLHFKTQDTGISAGDTEVTLSGKTFAGQAISGRDAIETVPPKKAPPLRASGKLIITWGIIKGK